MTEDNHSSFTLKDWYLPLIFAIIAALYTIASEIHGKLDMQRKRISILETRLNSNLRYIEVQEYHDDNLKDHEQRIRILETNGK